jgi:hypothetical protein
MVNIGTLAREEKPANLVPESARSAADFRYPLSAIRHPPVTPP